jgi:ATP/maltotriose-dependent transcriptional regulator MalT
MPEPHNLTSPDKQGQKGDVLLATKIGIPRIRAELLPRPHLIRRLEQATARELILVSTPAGFGKTTLLASWAKDATRPVAWLSLDGGDNDPARFWRYTVAAIDRIYNGIGEQALSLLNAPAQPTPRAVVTVLVNELAAHPNELVLVLDDYHQIESPAVHESLAFLLEHLPPGMHVVTSSRSDPPIPLARLRARGQLAELRAADLRFTLEEAAALLRGVWELDLSEEGIAALEERTEGWVTGLQLAALSLRGASDPTQFIQGYTGSQRYVLDYLTEEVLQGQPKNVQAFLLQTSILERLNAELCEAVLGVEKIACQQMLKYLEQANLFLVPLDEQRHWYRYHHLFADLLLTRLQSADPGRVPELHRKAAAWYEEHELVSEALRHAQAAGEAVWAARLVEQHVEEVLRRGEGETLRGWLAALPKEVVRARPRLALAQALAAFNAGHLREAEPLLDDAEMAFATVPNDPYEPSVGKEMSMLANVPASIALLRASLAALRGDAEPTTELVRQAQAHLADDERGPLISVRWNLAQADWMRGRLADAERAFAGIVSVGRETGEPHLTLTAGSVLGRIQQAQGRLEAALRTYQECLEFATQTGPSVVLSAAVAHVGMAEVFYERDQLEQALRHANEGISLGRQLTSTQALASGLATLAWIRQARGDPAGAREAMDEAHQVIPSLEIVSLHNPVPAEQARLSLAQGNVKETARWVAKRGLDEEDEPNYAGELEYLVLARYLLSRNEPDRALTLLEHLGALAEAQARLGSLIEIQVLQALGFQAAGKPDQAMKVLAQSLMQAEPEGYIRTFVDESRPMAGLLHRALSRGVTADYATRLLEAFPSIDQGMQPFPPAIAFPFNEPLSERELEVLRLLARGASNREIAEELSIALTTARKHVSNILGKLGVNNRTQAVSRGRDLGLL